MKVKKSSHRSTSMRSSASQTTEKSGGSLPLKSTEAIESVDRFEVGGGQHTTQDENPESKADEGELLEEVLEDPTLAKEVSWPVMLGQEELSSSVSSSFTGIIALIDTEDEEFG